jgi:hypothetical protein
LYGSNRRSAGFSRHTLHKAYRTAQWHTILKTKHWYKTLACSELRSQEFSFPGPSPSVKRSKRLREADAVVDQECRQGPPRKQKLDQLRAESCHFSPSHPFLESFSLPARRRKFTLYDSFACSASEVSDTITAEQGEGFSSPMS